MSEKGSPGWAALMPYLDVVKVKSPLLITASASCSAFALSPVRKYTSASSCEGIALLGRAYILPPALDFTLPMEGRLALAKFKSTMIRLFTSANGARVKSVFGPDKGVVMIGTLPNNVASVL